MNRFFPSLTDMAMLYMQQQYLLNRNQYFFEEFLRFQSWNQALATASISLQNCKNSADSQPEYIAKPVSAINKEDSEKNAENHTSTSEPTEKIEYDLRDCDFPIECLPQKIASFRESKDASINLIIGWVIASNEIEQPEFFFKIRSLEPSFPENTKLFYEILLMLVQKYHRIRKSKEELLKFLFRKSMKFIKQRFDEENKGKMRNELNQMFVEKFIEKKSKFKKEEPIRRKHFWKTSVINRISFKFLLSLLKNRSFFSAFSDFLSHFEELVFKENTKKISKLTLDINLLIAKGNLYEIDKIQQNLPWLKVWVKKCLGLGQELMSRASK